MILFNILINTIKPIYKMNLKHISIGSLLLISACQSQHSQNTLQKVNGETIEVVSPPKIEPEYHDKEKYLEQATICKQLLHELFQKMDNGVTGDEISVCLMGELDPNISLTEGDIPKNAFRQTGFGYPVEVASFEKKELEEILNAPVIYDDAYEGLHVFDTKSYHVVVGEQVTLSQRDQLPIVISVNAHTPKLVYVSSNHIDNAMAIAFKSPTMYAKIKKGIMRLVPWETPDL